MLHIGSMSNNSYHYESASSSGYSGTQFQRSRSIRSDQPLDLYGPLEIEGSVKSGSSIKFDGDFVVRGAIDAYGKIGMKGDVTCE